MTADLTPAQYSAFNTIDTSQGIQAPFLASAGQNAAALGSMGTHGPQLAQNVYDYERNYLQNQYAPNISAASGLDPSSIGQYQQFSPTNASAIAGAGNSLTPQAIANFNQYLGSQNAAGIDAASGAINPGAFNGFSGYTTNPFAGNVAAAANALNPQAVQQYRGVVQNPYVGSVYSAMGGIGTGAINQGTQEFLNPFLSNVVGATQANINENNAQQQQQVVGNALSSGAFGGDRQAVAQSELARQQDLASQQTIANLENQGYTTAQQNALGLGQFNAGLGMQGAQTLAGIGGQQSQLAAGLGQSQAQQQLQAASTLGQLGLGGQQLAGSLLGQAGQLELQGQLGLGQLGLGGEQLAGNLAAQASQLGLQGQLGLGQLNMQGNQLGAALSQANAQLGLQGASQLGQLGSQSMSDALALAQLQSGNLANAAQLQGGLGTSALSGALTGASAQLQSGAVQQAQNQALLNNALQQFYLQQQYPFQTSSFLSNIAEGLGSQQGGTTTSQVPQGNLFSELGGLGIAGLGLSSLLSDERAKENIAPIGMTFDKQPIYRFSYKGDPSATGHIGLMAQEVEKRHPSAVNEIEGLKGVNYWDATDAAASRGHFRIGGLALAKRPHFDNGGSSGDSSGSNSSSDNSGNDNSNSSSSTDSSGFGGMQAGPSGFSNDSAGNAISSIGAALSSAPSLSNAVAGLGSADTSAPAGIGASYSGMVTNPTPNIGRDPGPLGFASPQVTGDYAPSGADFAPINNGYLGNPAIVSGQQAGIINEMQALNPGMSTDGIIAQLGNFNQESAAPIGSLNPNAVNSVGAAGIAQDLGSRKQGLLGSLGIGAGAQLGSNPLSSGYDPNAGALAGTTNAQLAYNNADLNQNYPGVVAALNNPSMGLAQKVNAFGNGFEAPGSDPLGNVVGLDQRLSDAMEWGNLTSALGPYVAPKVTNVGSGPFSFGLGQNGASAPDYTSPGPQTQSTGRLSVSLVPPSPANSNSDGIGGAVTGSAANGMIPGSVPIGYSSDGTFTGPQYPKAQGINVDAYSPPDNMNSTLFGNAPTQNTPSLQSVSWNNLSSFTNPGMSINAPGMGGIGSPAAPSTPTNVASSAPAQDGNVFSPLVGQTQDALNSMPSPISKIGTAIGNLGTGIGNAIGGVGNMLGIGSPANANQGPELVGSQPTTPAALNSAMNFLSSHGGAYTPASIGSNGGPNSSGIQPPIGLGESAPPASAPVTPAAPPQVPIPTPQQVQFGLGNPAVSAQDAVSMYEAANGLGAARGGRIMRAAGGGIIPYSTTPTMPYGTFGSGQAGPMAGVSGIPVGQVKFPTTQAPNIPNPLQMAQQAASLNKLLSTYSSGNNSSAFARGGRAGYDDGGTTDQSGIGQPEDTFGAGTGGQSASPQAAPPMTSAFQPTSQDKALALMQAGFGMMASRSPFALQGIGEGAMQGVNYLMNARSQERQNAATQSEINYRAQSLQNEAKRIAQEGQYQSATTARANMLAQAQANQLKMEALKGSIYTSPMGPMRINSDGTLTPLDVNGQTAQSGTPGQSVAGVRGQPSSSSMTPTSGQPTGQFSVPLPSGLSPSPLLWNKAGEQVVTEAAQAAVKPAYEAALAAQDSKQILGELYKDYQSVPEQGWLMPGAGSAERLKFANAANTLSGVFGGKPIFDPDQLGAEQDIGKKITQLGVTVNKGLGREPGYILDKLTAAQPGMENNPQGRRLIMGGLMVKAQSALDYQDFLQRYLTTTRGSPIGAQQAFNQAQPESNYVRDAQIIARMPQANIDALRANPQAAQDFDRHFGVPGLSRYFLQ